VLVEQRPFVPTRPRAALTGALAAIAALVTGELVSAVAGSQVTLVTAVGNQVVDSLAGSLKDFAVALFGTHDKLALVIGIVVLSIGIAALLGVLSRRWPAAAPLGIAAFGVIGASLLARDPLGGTGVAVASGATAVVVGWAVLAGLWWSAARSTAGADPETSAIDRRAFLVGAGGTAVVSLAGWYVARRIRAGDSVESVRRSTTLPRPRRAVGVPASQPFEAPGLTSYVTSSEDFYRIDTALITPQVDASGWELRVHGMVDRPFTLSYDELLGLDSVEVPVTIQCVSNEVGGRLVGNAVWQGVPLGDLLERAGVQEGAEQVFSRSTDDWTCGFPLADAIDGRTALVAYAMNGEPLRAEHGYPARLIVAGLYGYVSATKWLREIELTRWDGVDGYWVPRGWSKLGPIKPASRIDVPNDTVVAGPQPIAGVAWAPNRGIDRVEVRVDDGPWRECRLGRTANEDTWVQWWIDWDATPGSHTLSVRATDSDGVTQTDERRAPAPDGATGWHTRTVTVA
jgi:DMSO/TMAO reductase YedYZ molybdopterin-dependent catalytic subunit